MFFPDLLILTEYLTSAVIVILYNSCVGPSRRFILLVGADELLPTPKIITFLCQSELANAKSERE